MSNSKKRFQKLLCASLALYNTGLMPVHATENKSHSDGLKPFLIGFGSTILGSVVIGGIVIGVMKCMDKETPQIPSEPTDEPKPHVKKYMDKETPQIPSKPNDEPKPHVALKPFSFNTRMSDYYRCTDGLKISRQVVANAIDSAIAQKPSAFDDSELPELQRQFKELYDRFGTKQQNRLDDDYDLWYLTPCEWIFDANVRFSGVARCGWAGHMTSVCSNSPGVKRKFAECVKFAYSKINDAKWEEHIKNFMNQFTFHGGHCEARFRGMVDSAQIALDVGLADEKNSGNVDELLLLLSRVKHAIAARVRNTAVQLYERRNDGSQYNENTYTINRLYSAVCFHLGISRDDSDVWIYREDPYGVVDGLLCRGGLCDILNDCIAENPDGDFATYVASEAKGLKISFNDYCKCCNIVDADKLSIIKTAGEFFNGPKNEKEKLFTKWVNGEDVELNLFDAQLCISEMAESGLEGTANLCAEKYNYPLFLIECFDKGYLGQD